MRDDTIRMLLKRPPVVVHRETSLRAVAETLTEESIGLVVVRGRRPPDAPGVIPEGVISERDLVRAVASGVDSERTHAEEIMTLDLASSGPDENVLAVAGRMLDNEIRHLLVMDDGVVIGVVSERDVLGALVGAAEPDRPHRS